MLICVTPGFSEISVSQCVTFPEPGPPEINFQTTFTFSSNPSIIFNQFSIFFLDNSCKSIETYKVSCNVKKCFSRTFVIIPKDS